jgi:hypothetical protein
MPTLGHGTASQLSHQTAVLQHSAGVAPADAVETTSGVCRYTLSNRNAWSAAANNWS